MCVHSKGPLTCLAESVASIIHCNNGAPWSWNASNVLIFLSVRLKPASDKHVHFVTNKFCQLCRSWQCASWKRLNLSMTVFDKASYVSRTETRRVVPQNNLLPSFPCLTNANGPTAENIHHRYSLSASKFPVGLRNYNKFTFGLSSASHPSKLFLLAPSYNAADSIMFVGKFAGNHTCRAPPYLSIHIFIHSYFSSEL